MQTIEKDFNYFYKQDLQQLFFRFYETKNFRFTDFLKVWNEFKFYQIFAIPRLFPIDYRFFMKDILKITVEYLYDEDLYPEVRAASLYTLFGIYANQINVPKLKIPVTPQQWIIILQFIDIITNAEHVDVEYAFRYLVHADAFEFCSTFEITDKGISNLKIGNPPKASKLLNEEKAENKQFIDKNKFKELVFKDELNEQIGTIHEAYMQCKEELSKNEDMKDIKNYINQDLSNLLGDDILEKNDKDTTSNADSKNTKETVFERIRKKNKKLAEDDLDDQDDDENDQETNESHEPKKNKPKGSKKKDKPVSRFNRTFQIHFLKDEENEKTQENQSMYTDN